MLHYPEPTLSKTVSLTEVQCRRIVFLPFHLLLVQKRKCLSLATYHKCQIKERQRVTASLGQRLGLVVRTRAVFKARQLRDGMGREGFLPRSFKLEFKQKTSLYIQAFNSPKSPQPIQIPDPDPRCFRNAERM